MEYCNFPSGKSYSPSRLMCAHETGPPESGPVSVSQRWYAWRQRIHAERERRITDPMSRLVPLLGPARFAAIGHRSKDRLAPGH